MQNTPELAKTISKRIATLRKGDNRTQRELAKDCDVPLAVINRTITGVSTPSPEALVKLATHYRVSVDWLLGLTEKKPRRKTQKVG